MFKLLILLPAIALMMGCAISIHSINNPITEPNATEVRDAWFEALDLANPDMHDSLLLALHLSRQTGAEVFVRRLKVEGAKTPPQRYRVSAERGSSDNVVGVNFATREFLFDHYLPADGPSIQGIRTRLRNAASIRRIKRDLGIFGDQ
ncbi:MAG: hypothetical protein HOK62_07580 [Verrucomicrobiales bacterium]|nr:hypothetical protein [Verrucomicrobiales bacterium]